MGGVGFGVVQGIAADVWVPDVVDSHVVLRGLFLSLHPFLLSFPFAHTAGNTGAVMRMIFSLLSNCITYEFFPAVVSSTHEMILHCCGVV